MLRITVILLVGYAVVLALVYFRQRSLLFLPTHEARSTRLSPWSDGAGVIGYCREPRRPRTIWLMMHGNAGQAADRDYVLPHLSDEDSLYVLEYPGYGARPGAPCLTAMNEAAVAAYRHLRSLNPNTPVCVLGESIGSGPACALTGENPPPDKIVLVVPFDSLKRVASHHFPFLPCGLLLRDCWDNVESLRHYTGPVEIYAAEQDTIIPPDRARALAREVSTARLIVIPGGHNDWSGSEFVRLRR